MAPYLAEDLEDWPISADDLAPHYRAVTEWMPLSARPDDLENELPLHSDAPDPLEASAQARAFVRDLDRARARLHRSGIRYGWSRLAVRASSNQHGRGCAYCKFCMNSCPYGLIYDTSSTLSDLIEDGDIDYIGDVLVERLEESNGRVVIRGITRGSEEPVRYEADRVYVACGPVATTRLLLSSMDAAGRSVEMKDSQYFLLPLLRLRGVPNPRDEPLHTLSQLLDTACFPPAASGFSSCDQPPCNERAKS